MRKLVSVVAEVDGEAFLTSAAALKWGAVEADQLGPSPVLLVSVPEHLQGPDARLAGEFMQSFQEWCKKFDGIVLFRSDKAQVDQADEAFMARHGWVRARKPKFAVGARVYAERHGKGEVLSVDDMAGYGYCYRLRLDTGHSTGGMVPEDKLREGA